MAENPQSETVPKGKIPALDGLRGLAILMVMVSHFVFLTWPNTGWYRVLQGGWIGVDLFFVLSGFLITGILLDSRERANGYFSRFYKRRALRIFPLYFFAIFVVWACVVFFERAPERLHGYDSWWWYVFFASNIAMALKDNWTYHSHFLDANHLWSIAVEEQFYLVWPLVVRFVPSRVALLFFCAALVYFSTDIRHLIDFKFGRDWSLAAYMLPFCRMDGLAAGGFLAVFFRLGWQERLRFDKWPARILLIWFGIWLFDAFWNGSTQFLGTMSALFFAAFLYLALNPDPRGLVRRFCESRFLMHLGVYSYGLYVFHHLPREIWQKQVGDRLLASGMDPFLAQGIYLVFAFGATYLLARLSWRFIEKPFLRMKD